MLRRVVMRVMRLFMCGPKEKWGSNVTPQNMGVSFEWEGVVVNSDLWCRVEILI